MNPTVIKAKENIVLLIFISLASALGGFLFGYDTVVIAGTISHVKAQFALSATMEGWFVSSSLVGCVAGVALAGQLSDKIGRKRVLIFSSLLLTISAIGCGLVLDYPMLITFRIIGGIGVGFASIVSPLYISEVSPPQFRGRLVSLFQLAITMGIVAAMFVNAYIQQHADAMGATTDGDSLFSWLLIKESWRGMFITEALPAGIFFILSLTIPESPRWLMKEGRANEAFTVLKKLRLDYKLAKTEMDEIKRAISSESSPLSQLLKPGLRKALFIGVFLAIFSELSGITIIMYYGPNILENAGFSIGDSLGGHVIIGIILAVCTLIAVLFVDKIGRKKLLLIGIAGAFIGLTSIGLLFLFEYGGGDLIVVFMCLFVGFFAFSLGPIKWIVMSEIFPTKIRGRAVGIATLSLWLTDVMINQFFPIIRDSFGIGVNFLLFAVFLIIHFFVVWKKMPETKGMTLEKIETLWISHVVIPKIKNQNQNKSTLR